MTTALVTGGNRGLGLATSLRLRDLGLSVVLTGRDARATRTAAESLGVEHAALDVADPASVARVTDELAAAGVDVDVLVCNAAVLLESGPLEIPEEELGRELATNLFGPWC